MELVCRSKYPFNKSIKENILDGYQNASKEMYQKALMSQKLIF